MIRSAQATLAWWCILGIGFLAPAARSQNPAPEALLPSETLFYTGIGDVEAFLKVSETKALGKILKEAEVKDFLEKPLALAKSELNKLLAVAKSHPGLEGIDLDPEKILDGPFGRSFVALTHFSMPAGAEEPDIGLILGVEPKEGAVDVVGMIRELAFALAKSRELELTSKQIQVGDLTYEKAESSEGKGLSLYFASVGGLSVLSLSETSIRRTLELAAGGEGSLAASARFRNGAEHVGQRSASSPVVYMHIGGMMGVALEGVRVGKAQLGKVEAQSEEAAVLDAMEQVIQKSGLLGLGSMYASSFWDGDVAVSRSFVETEGAAEGFFASLFEGREVVDRKMLEIVPKTAVNFTFSHFDLAPLYDSVMDALAEISPEWHAQARAMLDMVSVQVAGSDEDGKPTWDLRRDLIGAVGGQFVSMSTPGAPTMLGPSSDVVGWVQCSNPEGLEKSLDHLAAIPGKMWGFPISFNAQVEGGVKMRVLDPKSLGPMAMMTGGMQPSYAIHEGRMYFGTSPKAIKKLFAALESPPEENVTQNEDFMRAYSKIPADAALTTISYSDTATNFEAGYTAVLGMLPMLAMMGGPITQNELPFDMSLLPTAEAISQHLFGTVTCEYQVEGGKLGESRGPFGADMGVALGAAVGGGLLAGILAGASQYEEVTEQFESAAPPVAEKADPMERALRDLSDLSAAVTVYTVEFGSSPASLYSLVEPSESFPKGILQEPGLPVDPWGNSYSYQKRSDGYLLWSFGPNLMNEEGAGDDIKVEKR